MSRRVDEGWTVLVSYATTSVDRCVDLFRRPDGTYGFEEFRRDPEDLGAWTPLGYHSALPFDTETAARAAARSAVPWLDQNLAD
jgi:hypothetical protein